VVKVWSTLIEITWFALLVIIAIVVGYYLYPIVQLWAVVLALILVFVGSIVGYELFEKEK